VDRATIIYNPAAGQGRAKELLPVVESALAAAGVSYAISLTEGPGHAIELAAEAARSRASELVVAAGGDGTANEVINGLMLARAPELPESTPFPALGILCVGRGNDFAYGVGVPHEIEAAAMVLAGGIRKPLDIGLLRGGDYPDGRYFGNGVGVGFDTIVGLEAARMKHMRGFAGYIVAALRTLIFYYHTPLLSIRTDNGQWQQESILVSVMNGQRLGGAFFMAPEARTADGELDICIAGKPRRAGMLGLLLKYMKGTQASSVHVRTERTRTISLTSVDGPLAIHADGETICTAGSGLDVECLPSALDIIVPGEPPA
jgi:YegS/Rv2252/BmrU family lipid kinase